MNNQSVSFAQNQYKGESNIRYAHSKKINCHQKRVILSKEMLDCWQRYVVLSAGHQFDFDEYEVKRDWDKKNYLLTLIFFPLHMNEDTKSAFLETD